MTTNSKPKFKAGDRVDIVLLPKAIPIGQHLYAGRSGEIFRRDFSYTTETPTYEVRLDNGLIVPAGEMFLRHSAKHSKKAPKIGDRPVAIKTESSPDVKTRSQYRHMTKGFLIDTIFELVSELQSKKGAETRYRDEIASLQNTIESSRRQASEDMDVVNRCELMKILYDVTNEDIAEPGFEPFSWETILEDVTTAENTKRSVENIGEVLAIGMKKVKP